MKSSFTKLKLLKILPILQDDAAVHNKGTVIQYVNSTFGSKWMGTYSPEICCPPRSPDSTAPDYFLWGYLQSVVYKEMPSSVDNLKQKINDACSNIPSHVLVKATTNKLLGRLATCLEVDGHQLELDNIHNPSHVSLNVTPRGYPFHSHCNIKIMEKQF